ncbi:NAD(P)-dependent oxidoreductase [Nocardiopsis prasina]|uniref:NAD(P)-dependent oxidoreductase n=1 Tax=Nocardiopsis prasina TaxID=2015 RepID=UPI00036D469E|nr:NAD(P)-dependent oxidoreductase [Nocardiopsis prasina]
MTTSCVSSPVSSVAVIGLGAMGLPMAARLAGTMTVHGCDIAAVRRDLAAEAGVVPFEHAADAVAGVDSVVLVVRDGAQLRDVLFGEHGIVESLAPGTVLVLTSTVGVETVTATAEELAPRGLFLVDAPLSGGPVRAGEGDLLIVVGATPEAAPPPGAGGPADPVLRRLASTLSVIGDRPGDGQAFKTVNQLLCGVHIAAAAEALALARSLGLDPQTTLETLGAGAAGSFMLGNRGPRMLQAYEEEGAEVLSRLDIFVKDMGIVTSASRSAGLATPLAATAEQLYLLGQGQGLGAADDSAVIRVVAPEPTSKE